MTVKIEDVKLREVELPAGGATFRDDIFSDDGRFFEEHRCDIILRDEREDVDTIPLWNMDNISLNLPAWIEPDGLDHAQRIIETLGRSLHEHAYLVGKYLLWAKSRVGHGNFLEWVGRNVWFGERTARNMIAHSKRCDRAGFLMQYHPKTSKSATVADRPVRPRRPRWKIERSIAIFVETFFDEAAPDKELSIKIFPSTSESSEPIAHGPGRAFARYKKKEKNYVAELEIRAVSRT